MSDGADIDTDTRTNTRRDAITAAGDFDLALPVLAVLTSIPFDGPPPPDPDRDVGAAFFELF